MNAPDVSPAVLAALTIDLADTIAAMRDAGVAAMTPMNQVQHIDAALDAAFTASGQAGDFDQARLMLAVCLHFLLTTPETPA